jgi:para-aminobenzoate synthetase/4-amino-4-deoxychorismate lyase
MPNTPPFVLLDDATPGRARLTRFANPSDVIEAHGPADVPQAFAAVAAALAQGRHVAGYFSYELGYVLECRFAQAASAQPLLWFGVFDHKEEIAGPDAWLAAASTGRAYAGPLRHEWSAADYRARFDRVRAYITAGDIYQANLSFRSRFAFAGDALAFYGALRAQSGAAHGAFIDDGTRRILSLSPELFFALSADGRIAARPMKGTAARGGDAAADESARTRLAQSAKDRAENLMIVDLMRNDLGRIAETGSVEVPELFAVETYPTLHQMVSSVTARVRPQTSVDAVIRALFPCGSVTGAPKIRAMEIIRELEASPRGAYCGAIGYFAPDGSARFNVAIRTATIAGGEGVLGIGGAVVQDSDCDAEYAECLLKARYFEAARRPVALIETLGFTPADGFVRKALHLERMARSAEALGIPFDRTAAEAAVRGAVGDKPARVRLTLDESGALACTSAAMAAGPSEWSFAISPLRVASTDALARHKIDWRAHLDHEQARLKRELGADETIFLNERGEVAEGSRTTVFVQERGRLLTPPLSAGALDGCLRRALIAEGRCMEATLTPHDLETAEAVYLGNSLRGLIRAVPVERLALSAAGD